MVEPEETPDLSLARFARELSGNLLHWDGRLWSSLRELFLQPGQAAKGVVAGGEDRERIHPVRLYLVVNLLFFFVLPFLNNEQFTLMRNDLEILAQMVPAYGDVLAGEARRAGVTDADYRLELDAWIASHQGAFVAVMLPVLALLLWIFFGRRRRFAVEHLLLATSYYTVFLLSLLFVGFVGRVATALDDLRILLSAPLPWFLWLGWWMWSGQRRFYDVGKLHSLVVLPVTYVGSLMAFMAYTQALFWAGILALRLR